MTTLPPTRSSVSLRAGARAAVVAGVYLGGAVAVLLTVIVLRGLVPPAILSRFLGFVLIASLAAGLEPGTVKAAALGEGGVDGTSPAAYLAAGALKGLAASLVLAWLWRFADGGVSAATLAWTPAVAVAGVWATDLRAGLDLRGRYAMALVVKQGSLAGGIALAAGLITTGMPLSGAVGVSCVARLAIVGLVARRTGPTAASGRTASAPLQRQVGRLLGDRGWLDLAAVSAIGAAGGGADRLFGLRYLSPTAYGGYYLTYELFSKFWLLPYLLSPILFARRAARPAVAVGRDAFALAAWRWIGVAGAAYLAATAGLLVLAPALLRQVAGAAFGPATLAFAAAVVVNSFSQLRVAALQGDGRSRRATLAVALGAAAAAPLFYVAVRAAGADGLLVAWLVKSMLELCVLTADPGARPLKAG